MAFVGNKKNKQWIWLAIDRNTREIIGVHVGSRDHAGAQSLWESLPPVYRQWQYAIQIFGLHMTRSFPEKDIKLSVKKLVIQIILNALTIRCVKEFPD